MWLPLLPKIKQFRDATLPMILYRRDYEKTKFTDPGKVDPYPDPSVKEKTGSGSDPRKT